MASSVTECAQVFPACLTPADLSDAYFPGEPPEAPASEPQTIALVDAYNDPNARADLETYEQAFGLSRCPAARSSCFEQVNQKGETANLPFPVSEAARAAELSFCEGRSGTRRAREEACYRVIEAEGWAVEIATDIEVARGVCQNCKILLVEASGPLSSDLEAAEEAAAALRPTEISNSWGGEEPASDSKAFEHPGIPITASAGDGGYLNWTEDAEAEENGEEPYAGPDYPASSPHVIAVGGTNLDLASGVRQSETVWNDELGAGGGGCSTHFDAKQWQRDVPDWSKVGCEDRRAVADVSADADPDTGVAVYDSVPDFNEEEEGTLVNAPLEWWPIGGTSVASPIIASMFAIAGGSHGVEYPAETLYSHLGLPSLYDVTEGGNGECDDTYTGGCSGSMSPLSPLDCGAGVLICNAAAGYDGPTGVGAPDGIAAFTTESEAEHKQKVAEQKRLEDEEQQKRAAEKKAEEERDATESKTAAEKQVAEERTTAEEDKVEEERKAAERKGSEAEKTIKESLETLGLGESARAGGPSSTSHVATDLKPAEPTLSELALTRNATVALSDGRPMTSQIAFAFTLSLAARVRVDLAKEETVHGHKHWQALRYIRTIAAARGRNSARLSGHSPLQPGTYRLTLAPAHGAPRTLMFRVR
jgi:hypothetical protein